MKNNNIKTEKGAITLFTLIVCIFFTFLIVGAYNKTMNRLHVQEQEVQQIHDNYLRSVEMADEIYRELASITTTLVREGISTGDWINSVTLTGTGQVNSSTIQIVGYTFAKEGVDESALTFTTITPTSTTQQTTTVTQGGTYYFYLKDNNGDIHRSNKVEIFDVDGTDPIVGTLIAKKDSSTGELYTYDTWANTNVYIEKTNGSDPESGHKKTTYTVTKDNILYLVRYIHEKAIQNIFDEQELVKVFNENGIALVIQEDLPGSKIRGAFKVHRNMPAIYITYKHKRIADIYFALLHELAHCKSDFNKARSMSLISFEDERDIEIKADEQALQWMVENKYYHDFVVKKEYKIDDEIKYPKSFIVYRLAHDHLLKYSSPLYQRYNRLLK